MTKRIAMYAGSFDPITLGHIAIVRQALDLFDFVHVASGVNPDKKSGLFDHAERLKLMKGAIHEARLDLKRVGVSSYSGSIIKHARELSATVLVRGFRQVSDFDAEFKLHGVMEQVAPDLPMVHLICKQKFLFVSSSTAKELASIGEDMSWLVTDNVASALKEKFS